MIRLARRTENERNEDTDDRPSMIRRPQMIFLIVILVQNADVVATRTVKSHANAIARKRKGGKHRNHPTRIPSKSFEEGERNVNPENKNVRSLCSKALGVAVVGEDI